ncbi:hypothetical protein P4J23_10905 [Bacillus cereus]|nr:hypothetical protein [Bacillus cereus]
METQATNFIVVNGWKVEADQYNYIATPPNPEESKEKWNSNNRSYFQTLENCIWRIREQEKRKLIGASIDLADFATKFEEFDKRFFEEIKQLEIIQLNSKPPKYR